MSWSSSGNPGHHGGAATELPHLLSSWGRQVVEELLGGHRVGGLGAWNIRDANEGWLGGLREAAGLRGGQRPSAPAARKVATRSRPVTVGSRHRRGTVWHVAGDRGTRDARVTLSRAAGELPVAAGAVFSWPARSGVYSPSELV